MGFISFEDLCKMEGIDEEFVLQKMSPERFKELLDELDGNSLNTLKEKNARYATDGDCLHNFRSGAKIAGGTPAQACWGYMTKHLTALRDMVMKNDFSNREDFLEKCQDTINYIRFLWCIGNDEEDIKKNKTFEEKCAEYCRAEVESTMELYKNMHKESWRDCVYLCASRNGELKCLGTKECEPCRQEKCDHIKIITVEDKKEEKPDYSNCPFLKKHTDGAETCLKPGHQLYCDGKSCKHLKAIRERKSEEWKQCVFLTVKPNGFHCCTKTCDGAQCYMTYCRHYELPKK